MTERSEEEMNQPQVLESILVVSGTAMDDGPRRFRGFLTVSAKSEDGDLFIGQLTPDEIRMMALGFLEAAESADQDCIVMTMLTQHLGLDDSVAAGFVSAMRDEREGRGGEQDVADGDGPGLPSGEPAEAEDPSVPGLQDPS
jgi:hypothetical protein